MENIKLALTVEEANIILATLGQQPYIKVADLIQKIQSQGASQLNGSQANGLATVQNDVNAIIPAEDGK